MLAKAASVMREAGGLGELERWQVDWQSAKAGTSRQMSWPRLGGFNRLEPAQLNVLSIHLGLAIGTTAKASL